MVEVSINGYTYFADIRNRIPYEDRERTKGTPFNYLTKNESEQLEKELRFPKTKKVDKD